MKKWIIRISAVILAVILLASLWLYFYHSRKSLDNIPSKELMLTYLEEKGKGYALEKIQGYPRDALIEIWGDPVWSLFGMFGDIWEAENGAFIVYFDSNGKAVDIMVSEAP